MQNKQLVNPEPNEGHLVGLYLDVVDINAVYSANKNPRILQDISKNLPSLKDVLFTTIDKANPLIDNKPSCDCGVTTITQSEDDTCPICFSTIMPVTDRSITPSVYMGTPWKVNDILYPYVYHSLRVAFKIGIARYPYNPFVALLGKTTPDSPLHKVILNRMPKELIGYNNAVGDLPNFIITLANIVISIIAPKERGIIPPAITQAHSKNVKAMLPELYDAIRFAEAIKAFNLPYKAKVLPVRSKLLMTLEEGTYSSTSTSTDLYAKAIVFLNNMPYDQSLLTARERSNYRPDQAMVKFHERYFDFRHLWYSEEGRKCGGMRTDTITSRSGMVLRSVQTQICEPHRSDDIWFPYSSSIILYQVWLVRWYKVKYKWSSDKIIQHLEKYLRKYDKELHDALQAIASELDELGAVAYAVRYPSIYRTSGLTKAVTRIKCDPNDNTVGLSATAQPACNGDYDGDQLTVVLVVIKKVALAYKRLRVRTVALDIANEGKMADYVQLPNPVQMCWGNYLRGIDVPNSPLIGNGYTKAQHKLPATQRHRKRNVS